MEQEEGNSPWNGYPLKQGRCMAAVAPKLLVTVMLLCSNRWSWAGPYSSTGSPTNTISALESIPVTVLVLFHGHSLVTMQLITNTLSWAIDWRRRRTVLATLTD